MLLRYVCPAVALVSVTFAQTPVPQRQQPQPVYRVTIVQRTTPALNYGHREEPTKIDFKGTPLLPEAHGDATVDTRHGAAAIDAHFDRVPPPTRFGSQYLTYVLWAISPEGHAQNLGEVELNGSDKGRLKVTTPMQTFALIITAEPYFSVTQPSDVVVMENAVRPDTVAKVEQVNASYELLPRGAYTYNPAARAVSGAPVSQAEYDAIVAVYQAENAIQIARAAGAQQYAADRLARAEQDLRQARYFPRKQLSNEVVSLAREAAQIAEDARLIAVRRSNEERIALERRETAELKRDDEAQRVAAAAAESREQAARARAEAARAESVAVSQAAPEPRQPAPLSGSAERLRTTAPDITRQNRARLLSALSAVVETRDTPRGVIIVVPDAMIASAAAAQNVRDRLERIAPVLRAYPGLRYEVQGNTDAGQPSSAAYATSRALAERVREMLIAGGIPASSIAVEAFGNSRPVDSNATASGRERNRRVEIVISGAPIGKLALWDRTYALK